MVSKELLMRVGVEEIFHVIGRALIITWHTLGDEYLPKALTLDSISLGPSQVRVRIIRSFHGTFLRNTFGVQTESAFM